MEKRWVRDHSYKLLPSPKDVPKDGLLIKHSPEQGGFDLDGN